MGTEVRTVPTDAHWASHAEKTVHLLPVAVTKIAAEHAKLSPEAVLRSRGLLGLVSSAIEGLRFDSLGVSLLLAVRSVNSMKTSTGLSRLEIDCGRPARHFPPRNYLH
jgi:hypothetical protein